MTNTANLLKVLEQLNSSRTPTTLLITTKTEQRLLKKGPAGAKNELGPVFAIRSALVIVNQSYEATVNAHRAVEGKSTDFVAGARKWGDEVNGMFITKGDELYLNTILKQYVGDTKYVNQHDLPVSPIKITPFLQHRKISKSSGAGRPSPGADVQNLLNPGRRNCVMCRVM